MKIRYMNTVNAVSTPDYMGKDRWSTHFDAEKECQHLLFTLCKNYVKINNKKSGEIVAVVPLLNVSFFRPYLDIISEDVNDKL
jgi:hypothetical protein